MMKFLIDCDVLLDVALHREPHFASSAAVLDWAERNPGKACLAWHTVANLFYLIDGKTTRFIEDLVRFTEIPPTGTEAVKFALRLQFRDFEDALQVAAANQFHAQAIVTRNVKHYKKSPIQPIHPSDLLRLL
jgi:predicted nucleic acid-binding protein